MTDPLFPSSLLAPLYSSAEMRAVLDDRARIQRMLDFEAALVRAQAAVGVMQPSNIAPISDCCRADKYDLAALAEAAVSVGDLANPLVKALTAKVAERNKAAAGFVHWGASSQDVIDTATVLELRAAIDLLLTDLDRATKAFIALAGKNRRNMTVARTFLQQALPMPFGLKLAGYAAALSRSRERLRRLRKEALVLQFGGAAGTLAALGDKGLDISERLAALLDLTVPDGPWHSHRDRLAEVASAFAILAGTCGKIARDVALLAQSEVAEAFEPSMPGQDSPTLPHKRNPVGAAAALSAAMVAPNLAATILNAQIQQEHERSVGGWQSEWVTFPALALVVSGTLRTVVDIAEGLIVDVDRMKANLEASGGLVFTEAVTFVLAEKTGRVEAHELVAELVRKALQDKRPFKDIVAEDERIKTRVTATELERLFMPNHYQGSAQTFIDRLVASSQGRTVRRSASVSHLTDPRMPSSTRLSETSPVVAAKPLDKPVSEEPPKPAVEPFGEAVAAASALIAQTISELAKPPAPASAPDVAAVAPVSVAPVIAREPMTPDLASRTPAVETTPAPALETSPVPEVAAAEPVVTPAPLAIPEPTPPPVTVAEAPALDDPAEEEGALLQLFAQAAENENEPAPETERKPA